MKHLIQRTAVQKLWARSPVRRNPIYTVREESPGRWEIVGTHKWFTSKARAEAWVTENKGREVRAPSQERLPFRERQEHMPVAHKGPSVRPTSDAAAKYAAEFDRARDAARAAVMRESQESAERMKATLEANDAERVKRARKAKASERVERLRNLVRESAERDRIEKERHAEAQRVEAEQQAANRTRRAAEDARAEREKADRLAEFSRVRAERRQAEQEASERLVRDRIEAERLAAERSRNAAESERVAAEAEQERRRNEWYAKKQSEAAEQQRKEREAGRAEYERAKAAAESDEERAKKASRKARAPRGSTKAPKVEWVHVAVNTWLGVGNPGPNEYALLAAVYKQAAIQVRYFGKRADPYEVVGTEPALGHYLPDRTKRIKALGRMPRTSKIYSRHATLNEARDAAVVMDATLRAADEKRNREEQARSDEYARKTAEQNAARQRTVNERMANNPWTDRMMELTWSENTSAYGTAHHAAGPDGKQLFCFVWRRGNGNQYIVYDVTGTKKSFDPTLAEAKIHAVMFGGLGMAAMLASAVTWPPRPTPRWQDVRDRLESEARRQEDEARRQQSYSSGSSGRSYAPPPPSGLHGFKRWQDLGRMAEAKGGASENERAFAVRQQAKMQAEWDAASVTEREGLRGKWHRANPRSPTRRATVRTSRHRA